MILNFPSGRQTFGYDCGAKALQLVLAYYGIDVREDKLLEELQCTEIGVLVKNMVEVARQYGLHVESKPETTLDEIKSHILKGHPVIVLIQAWADKDMTEEEWRQTNEFGHYVVVIGYEDGKLIFSDPSSFPRTWLTGNEFMVRWHFEPKGLPVNLNRLAVFFDGKEPADMNQMVHLD